MCGIAESGTGVMVPDSVALREVRAGERTRERGRLGERHTRRSGNDLTGGQQIGEDLSEALVV